MLLHATKGLCAADLMAATRLAGQVFQYAASRHLRTFDRAHMCQHCGPAAWLLERGKPLTTAIRRLLNLSRRRRIMLNASFQHDLGFAAHRDDLAFEFHFHPAHRDMDATAFAAGKALMVAFYKHILSGAGFRDMAGQQFTPLTIRTVEDEYRTANAASKSVCPACLARLPASLATRSLVEREHFFPKTKYPALSIHPDNLIPICPECNRVHGSVDPILPPRRGGLRRLFLPYSRPGMTAVKFRFSRAAGQHVVRLTPAGRGRTVTHRVANHDRLYKISERHTGELRERGWDELLSLVVNADELPTRALVRGRLSSRSRQSHARRAVEADAMLVSQYARWIRDNAFQAFFDELRARRVELRGRPEFRAHAR